MSALSKTTKIFVFFFTLLLNGFLPAWANNPTLKEAIQDADYLFCIDGGGSKTTLHVVNAKMEPVEIEHKGKKTFSVLTGPTNINFVDLEDVKKNLVGLLEEIKIGPEKRDLSEIVGQSAIVSGIAGLVSNADLDPTVRDLFALFGFSKSRIALFADVILAKQIIKDEGTVLISGTGSIAFGKSPMAETRIGGLGYALGDEGSGFYIGKLALQKAFQDEFEKKPFALTKKIREHFKVESLAEVIKPFYAGQLKSADVAKIAPLVFEAAYKEGDKRCQNIIDTNAAALAKLVKRAVKKTSCPNYPVYLLGGVFKNENAPDFIESIRKKVSYSHGLEFINISEKNIAVEAVLSNKEDNL